jgi:DNA-binding IclR family transcriptional regulator
VTCSRWSPGTRPWSWPRRREPEADRLDGALPSHEEVQALLEEAYAACIPVDDGEVADHIPALAAAPRDAFGACIAGIAGGLYEVGRGQALTHRLSEDLGLNLFASEACRAP